MRWADIAREKREQLLAWGNEALAGYPMLTASQFLAFSRTGKCTSSRISPGAAF